MKNAHFNIFALLALVIGLTVETLAKNRLTLLDSGLSTKACSI